MNAKGKGLSFGFLAALTFALLIGFSTHAKAAVAPVTELYGHATDGTPLHWVVYQPSAAGPWPVVLVIHGGGFDSGTPTSTPESVTCAQDLAAAGYLALSIEYRLAPPGKLPGQKSEGLFPDQTSDVQLAVRTARSDPRCNGQVGAVGGSAGGHHAALAATTGTPGDDRLDVAVCLSGIYDMSDFSPNPNIESFTDTVTNFVGVTASNVTALRAASPAWLLDKTASPLFLVNSLEDPAPYSQLPDMVGHLDEEGVTNYQVLTLTGDLHSFHYWSEVKNQAIAFLAAGFAGGPGPTPSPTPSSLDAKQLLNVSTRGDVETGGNVMIGGFIITGSIPKRVVLRGLGPSLSQPGIGSTLSDPMLQLFDSSGVLVESNDNWNLAGGLPSDLIPKSPKESVLSAFLPAGDYTAVLSGAGSAQGIGLFELYDVAPTDSQVSNISTRGLVGTGSDVIIGGFIVGGAQSTLVIVRALGPSLSSSGVANALQDPYLDLYDSNGTLLASNDNWRSTQEQEIINTSIPPPNDRESAIVASLPSGSYTAIVSGVGGSTGVALVEAYNISPH